MIMAPSCVTSCVSCTCPFSTETNIGNTNFEFYENSSISFVGFNEAIDFIYGVTCSDIFEHVNSRPILPQSIKPNTLKFCEACGKLLELCYIAHKNFENSFHPQSLLQEIKKQSVKSGPDKGTPEIHSMKKDVEESDYLEDTASSYSFPDTNDDNDEFYEDPVDVKYDLSSSATETSECGDNLKSRLRKPKVIVKLEELSDEYIPIPIAKESKLRKSKSICTKTKIVGSSSTKRPRKYTVKGSKESVKISKTSKASELKKTADKIPKPSKTKEATNKKEPGKIWKCETCGKEFTNYSHYKYRHLPEHTSTGKSRGHLCHLCGKHFCRRDYLKFHNMHVHGSAGDKNQRKEVCAVCGKLVFSLVMKAHLWQHNRRTVHKCDQCDKVCSSSSQLKEHVAGVHTDTSFKCDLCQKIFLTEKTLKTHMKTHGPKTCTCDQCPSKFWNKSLLKKHKLTHTTERSLTCEECGKTFKYKSHFSLHLRIHREIAEKGVGSIQCEECGKNFAHSHSLYKHKVEFHRHNPNRQLYKCSFCGKLLSGAKSLRMHEDLHRKDSNYVPRKQGEGQKLSAGQTRVSSNSGRNAETYTEFVEALPR